MWKGGVRNVSGQPGFSHCNLGSLGPCGGGGSLSSELEVMAEADPESHTELEMSDA